MKKCGCGPVERPVFPDLPTRVFAPISLTLADRQRAERGGGRLARPKRIIPDHVDAVERVTRAFSTTPAREGAPGFVGAGRSTRGIGGGR
jgi:hypothetical protein